MAIGKSQFEFGGLIVARDDTLRSKNLSIKIGTGRIKIDFTTEISPHSLSTEFDLDMKKVPLESLSFVLPEGIKEISGITNTRVTGNWASVEGRPKYNIKVNSSTKEGEIKDLEINGFIAGLCQKRPHSQ